MHITKTGPVKNKPVQFRGHPNPYRQVGRPGFHISSFHGDLESGIGVPNSGMSETRKWFSLHTLHHGHLGRKCGDNNAPISSPVNSYAGGSSCLRSDAPRASSAVCALAPDALFQLFALRRTPLSFRWLRSSARRASSAVCAPAPAALLPLFALRRTPLSFRCLRSYV